MHGNQDLVGAVASYSEKEQFFGSLQMFLPIISMDPDSLGTPNHPKLTQLIILELCSLLEHIPRVLCSHSSVVLQHSTAELFYDLTTLSNTELEHAQSYQHLLVEWVWSINHRHAEQKRHDL